MTISYPYWLLLSSSLSFSRLVVHWYFGIEVVYSHFFYIPVVLAGIWYGVRGVPVAVLLGAVLIVGTYASTGTVDIGID